MQLNVPQQVPLLCEGSTTLVTLEWPLTCGQPEENRILKVNKLSYGLY